MKKQQKAAKPFYKFLPTYLNIGIMWLVGQLPYKVLIKLSGVIGALFRTFLKSRVKVATKNIQTCFPDMPKAEQQRLIDNSFDEMALGFLELCKTWFGNRNTIRNICKIEGLEHIEACNQNGQGVLIAGYHLTSLEIANSALSYACDFQGMYKPTTNPVFERIMFKRRHRHGGGMIPRDQVRPAIKHLRNKGVFWCAVDQNNASKDSPFVPFFGTPARTVTAISRYAKMGKAKVIPMTQIRDKKSGTIRVILHPQLESIPCGDEYQDALVYNQFLEQWLTEHPEDYMWLHKRFRSRPEGEPKFY
jgi:Kdo2-lipid IVA lauroyltransferase/acyltransferase